MQETLSVQHHGFISCNKNQEFGIFQKQFVEDSGIPVGVIRLRIRKIAAVGLD